MSNQRPHLWLMARRYWGVLSVPIDSLTLEQGTPTKPTSAVRSSMSSGTPNRRGLWKKCFDSVAWNSRISGE